MAQKGIHCHSAHSSPLHLIASSSLSVSRRTMLFYLTSRIVSAVGAFLYPGYASYKTLSQRPASEEEIERWLMYWTVLGCIVGVEYVAEWAVCWIPLYYPIKTLFLLYLALPQTRGATFIYTVHLRPLFAAHEADIDSALAQLRVYVYNLLQSQLRSLWAYLGAAAGQTPESGPPTQASPQADPNTAGLNLPGAIGSFWRTYGPGIMASGAALLQPAAVPTQAQRPAETRSVLERRRQLEAELAALSAADPIAMPMPSPSTTYSARSSDASLHQRNRADSSQFRFEEVEVPSDVEGYDTRDDSDGPNAARPSPAQRGSWFAWGGAARQGYERVKTE
ncbi:Protein YOP1 [Mycena indigotica]|uniref:Protein YOP1 n=1 Tax=Mycena indigotica TaxID=2126181 RepID=A0A8H6S5W2_9AGAR|nr:Protein YOP1 [Mycena indigotica]KAF7292800.1 Protein YOP1 [Mycena indigotica]